MPSCIIEYTRDVETRVDIKALVDIAFNAIEDIGLFDRATIKARAIGYDHYKSGQDRDDYIHVSIKILSGRTAAQKKHLSDHMIEKLTPHVANTKSLTVDIIDMDIDSYGKKISS